MTITFAMPSRWCPQSGRECWPVRLGSSSKARCWECGRWLRPRTTADGTEVLPHHLPEKPRRGR